METISKLLGFYLLQFSFGSYVGCSAKDRMDVTLGQNHDWVLTVLMDG
jgi:hypothetical protein